MLGDCFGEHDVVGEVQVAAEYGGYRAVGGVQKVKHLFYVVGRLVEGVLVAPQQNQVLPGFLRCLAQAVVNQGVVGDVVGKDDGFF